MHTTTYRLRPDHRRSDLKRLHHYRRALGHSPKAMRTRGDDVLVDDHSPLGRSDGYLFGPRVLTVADIP